MTLIKTRVPAYTEKHLVCEIETRRPIMYADITLLRDHSFKDEIPVYIANDISDMVLYCTMSRYELNELDIY